MGIDHMNAFPANNKMLACRTGGMDLRDWFAGMALQGMLSNNRNQGKLPDYAHDSYCYADAMMEQRKRPATSGKE